MIVLDTCIFLCYALDEEVAENIQLIFDKIRRKEELSCIPATVLSELFAILTKRGMKDIAVEIEEFIFDLGINIEPIARDLAVLGGLLKAKYSTGKKGFSYNDALILALAIQNNASIYTFDSEFEGITEVEVINPGQIRQ